MDSKITNQNLQKIIDTIRIWIETNPTYKKILFIFIRVGLNYLEKFGFTLVIGAFLIISIIGIRWLFSLEILFGGSFFGYHLLPDLHFSFDSNNKGAISTQIYPFFATFAGFLMIIVSLFEYLYGKCTNNVSFTLRPLYLSKKGIQFLLIGGLISSIVGLWYYIYVYSILDGFKFYDFLLFTLIWIIGMSGTLIKGAILFFGTGYILHHYFHN